MARQVAILIHGSSHTGSLMIADSLSIDLGYALVAGLVASVPVAILVLAMSKWFERKYDFPMRRLVEQAEDGQSIMAKEDSRPPLVLSICPSPLG